MKKETISTAELKKAHAKAKEIWKDELAAKVANWKVILLQIIDLQKCSIQGAVEEMIKGLRPEETNTRFTIMATGYEMITEPGKGNTKKDDEKGKDKAITKPNDHPGGPQAKDLIVNKEEPQTPLFTMTKEDVMINYKFSEDEKKGLSLRLAQEIELCQQIRSEAKQIAAGYKAKIEKSNSDQALLANNVSTGSEMKKMRVEVRRNFKTGTKEYFSIDDGTLLGSDKMDAKEFQLKVIDDYVADEQKEETKEESK